GTLRQYPGNYSVYLDYKEEEQVEAAKQHTTSQQKKEESAKSEKSERQSSNNGKRRRLSTWEKREFEELEGKIAQLEAEKAQAEDALFNA
ncbi:MAG TPA: multidrug ABC transporter ATP-binding protein, partial [Cyanobacteria bacterium UBA11148]|nr:multidrug ABC transporter ATP-binding protein [Cyanobacteria bacterium UBA11148]